MGLRYKVLRKGGENMNQRKLICPKCKADLTVEDAIENIRTGAQRNFLSFNAHEVGLISRNMNLNQMGYLKSLIALVAMRT
jgi:hypothetical protein